MALRPPPHSDSGPMSGPALCIPAFPFCFAYLSVFPPFSAPFAATLLKEVFLHPSLCLISGFIRSSQDAAAVQEVLTRVPFSRGFPRLLDDLDAVRWFLSPFLCSYACRNRRRCELRLQCSLQATVIGGPPPSAPCSARKSAAF